MRKLCSYSFLVASTGTSTAGIASYKSCDRAWYSYVYATRPAKIGHMYLHTNFGLKFELYFIIIFKVFKICY